MPIVVLDIGKTNAKTILLHDTGEMLAQRSRACAVRPGPPYPHLDLDGMWSWAMTALGELASLALSTRMPSPPPPARWAARLCPAKRRHV